MSRDFNKPDALCDLVVKAGGGKVFYAHKQVLSQWSPVLLKQWGTSAKDENAQSSPAQGDTLPAHKNLDELPVGQPGNQTQTGGEGGPKAPPVKKEELDWGRYGKGGAWAMLQHMYPPYEPLSENVIPEVLPLAKDYEMELVTETCEKMLLRSLRNEELSASVVRYLALGSKNKLDKLTKEAGKKIIHDQFFDVNIFESPEFQDVPPQIQIGVLIGKAKELYKPPRPDTGTKATLQERVEELTQEIEQLKSTLEVKEDELKVLKEGTGDKMKEILLQGLKMSKYGPGVPEYMKDEDLLW